MTERRLSWVFELVSTMAIVAGVIYGAIELRALRHAREREALAELLHTFETPEYNEATALVRSLPDSASVAQVNALAGDRAYLVGLLANTWETLGYQVHQHHIPLEFIEQSQGGSVRSTWQKLKPYALERRKVTGRPTWEWYQWLVDQLNRHYPQEKRRGAYDLYKDWEP